MVGRLLLLILGLLSMVAGACPATARSGSMSQRPQTPIHVLASPPSQPELVADLGGDMRRILVAGGLAYVGENIGGSGMLSVLDPIPFE